MPGGVDGQRLDLLGMRLADGITGPTTSTFDCAEGRIKPLPPFFYPGASSRVTSLEGISRSLVLSSDLRALIVFFTPLLGILLVVWMNVRFVRSHIGKWNSRFTILFVLSLGQFRQKQKEVWRLRAGYDETEANIIIKYQMLCLLEISLGFIISILARHHFLHP